MDKLSALILVSLLSLSFLVGQSFAAPIRFDGPRGRGVAAFISPSENMKPTPNIERITVLLEDAGYAVERVLDETASLSFLKTELANYDLIVLRLDTFYYEGFNYFCAGEPFEQGHNSHLRSEYASEYAAEIAAREISVKGPCLGFSMLYIMHNYKTGLHGLVLAYGPGTPELAAAFLRGGSDTFISYDSPVDYSLGWGRFDNYAENILQLLADGNSVRNAVAQFYLNATRGHGVTASWPSIYWTGDGNYTI